MLYPGKMLGYSICFVATIAPGKWSLVNFSFCAKIIGIVPRIGRADPRHNR